jgi:hypothetical protein
MASLGDDAMEQVALPVRLGQVPGRCPARDAPLRGRWGVGEQGGGELVRGESVRHVHGALKRGGIPILGGQGGLGGLFHDRERA